MSKKRILVQLKSWERLQKEYIEDNGSIHGPMDIFTSTMREKEPAGKEFFASVSKDADLYDPETEIKIEFPRSKLQGYALHLWMFNVKAVEKKHGEWDDFIAISPRRLEMLRKNPYVKVRGRVKTWEEMRRRYPASTESGMRRGVVVGPKNIFTSEMKPLCNKLFTSELVNILDLEDQTAFLFKRNSFMDLYVWMCNIYTIYDEELKEWHLPELRDVLEKAQEEKPKTISSEKFKKEFTRTRKMLAEDQFKISKENKAKSGSVELIFENYPPIPKRGKVELRAHPLHPLETPMTAREKQMCDEVLRENGLGAKPCGEITLREFIAEDWRMKREAECIRFLQELQQEKKKEIENKMIVQTHQIGKKIITKEGEVTGIEDVETFRTKTRAEAMMRYLQSKDRSGLQVQDLSFITTTEKWNDFE